MANEYNRCHLTVRFNANGGTGAPSEQSAEKTSRSDKITVTVYVPSAIPTKTGHTFSSWYGDDGKYYSPGNGVTYTFLNHGSQGTVQYNTITLTAQYTANTYTVSYNANGGSGAPSAQTKTYGVNLTLSSTKPTRQYYNFKGWATSATGAVAYAAGATYTANAAVVLYAVWELAAAPLGTITSPVEVGSSGTASWTILNASHTYKLVLTCGDAPPVTVDVAANTSSCTFAIPNTWLDYIINSGSATATATLTTYNGDTQLGSSAKTFTVNVPSGIVPTITSFTASHYSSNATVASWGEFAQGFSCADLTVVATPGTGATITAITFAGPSINSTGTATTARTGVLNGSGDNTFTVTVTDSRGRTASTTLTVYVYPYSIPTIFDINTFRADADGTTNNSSGEYLKVQPVYSLSSVNGNNTFSVQTLSYCLHGAGTPIDSMTCASGTTYAPPDVQWAVGIADSYDVTVAVTDALGGSTTATVTLPGAAGIWYSRANNALGLGAAPTRANLFSCDWDAEFHGVVDTVPRRCEATLATVGWHRAIVYDAYDSYSALGYSGEIVTIKVVYTSSVSCQHVIKLFLSYNKIVFLGEESYGTTNVLDKIRYTVNGSKGYVDIHWTSTTACQVNVSFEVASRAYAQGNWIASDLTGVADSPTGETVVTTYLFVSETPSLIYKESTASIPTSTWTTVYSLSLTKGRWFVWYKICFPFNATGYRASKVTTSGGSGLTSAFDDAKMATTSVFGTYCGGEDIITVNPDTDTVLVRGIQNSGSTMTAWYSVRAIRIA